MRLINLNLDQSEAVVGWNSRGLVGYALHKGDTWSCVTSTQPGPLLHVCRHGDAALRWLHENGQAEFFESLDDPRDLNGLIDSQASPVTKDHMAKITAQLSNVTRCD